MERWRNVTLKIKNEALFLLLFHKDTSSRSFSIQGHDSNFKKTIFYFVKIVCLVMIRVSSRRYPSGMLTINVERFADRIWVVHIRARLRHWRCTRGLITRLRVNFRFSFRLALTRFAGFHVYENETGLLWSVSNRMYNAY